MATGTAVLRALLGAYQTAAASVSTPAYRVLYASLAASVSQQLATLAARAGQNAIEPFPDRNGPRSRERCARGLPGLGGRRETPHRTRDPHHSRVGGVRLRRNRTHPDRAAHDLRSRVTDGCLPRARSGSEVQLRRFQHPRDADSQRRARGHLRLGCAAQHAAPLRAGTRRQARHVHLESARLDRSEVEPGGPPFRLRPQAQAGEARHRRRGRSGRCVHPNGAAQDGAHLRPVQGREPGDRRPRCYGQGRTRAGRRWASCTSRTRVP